MWKVIGTAAMLLLLSTEAGAQSDCPKYKQNVADGRRALSKGDLKSAFVAFRDAQIYARYCHLANTSEADKGLQEAFDRMGELSARADSAETKALAAQGRAEAA